MEGKTELAAHTNRYLAHLAHELRTPLNAVIGYADAMRAQTFGPLDQRYGEYAEIIGDAGRHMLCLAEDLLARARIDAPREPGTTEPLDPAEPVAWALRLMAIEANAADLALHFTPPTRPLRIVSEGRALAQIVVNLVANAIRHTPPGGAVTVTLESRDDGVVDLTVSDTGSGLPPGAQSAGMGLGLVRELVEADGGTMDFTTGPGMGTLVTVSLPSASEAS